MWSRRRETLQHRSRAAKPNRGAAAAPSGEVVGVLGVPGLMSLERSLEVMRVIRFFLQFAAVTAISVAAIPAIWWVGHKIELALS